jgi:hypothetical protein
MPLNRNRVSQQQRQQQQQQHSSGTPPAASHSDEPEDDFMDVESDADRPVSHIQGKLQDNSVAHSSLSGLKAAVITALEPRY